MGLAVYTLWRRDVTRFLRQRSRIVGALGTPLLFWAMLGAGLGRSFQGPVPGAAAGYLQYFFPGALAMMVLFTAIFSTISVIDDRHEGFLQGVMVAPVPPVAIVLAKLLGGTTLAVLQAAVFLALAPAASLAVTGPGVLGALGVVLLLGFALTGLGFVFAWRVDSTQGFHAVMNLVLFPMWLLSGAVFPASGAAGWIRALMAVNPLTYGVAALQQLLLGHASGPSLVICLAVTVSFALTMLLACVLVVGRRRAA